MLLIDTSTRPFQWFLHRNRGEVGVQQRGRRQIGILGLVIGWFNPEIRLVLLYERSPYVVKVGDQSRRNVELSDEGLSSIGELRLVDRVYVVLLVEGAPGVHIVNTVLVRVAQYFLGLFCSIV